MATSPFQGIPIRSDDDGDDDDDDDDDDEGDDDDDDDDCLIVEQMSPTTKTQKGYIIHLYNIKAKLVASFLAF